MILKITEIIKIEQASPIHIDDWTNQQHSSTVIVPPTTITTSICDKVNYSCCDSEGQFYPSLSSSL